MIEFVLYAIVSISDYQPEFSKELGRYTGYESCIEGANKLIVGGTGDPVIDRNDVLFICNREEYI